MPTVGAMVHRTHASSKSGAHRVITATTTTDPLNTVITTGSTAIQTTAPHHDDTLTANTPGSQSTTNLTESLATIAALIITIAIADKPTQPADMTKNH